MKKIKLSTSSLKLKKEEIANLSHQEMKHVYGGETGPCTTSPCTQVPSQAPVCNLTDQSKTCDTAASPAPGSPGGGNGSQILNGCPITPRMF